MCIRDSNVAAVVFGVLVDSKVGSDDADGRLLCPVGTACRGQWFEEGTGVVNNGIEAVELGGNLWPQPAPVSYTHLDVYKRQRFP